MTKEDRFDKVLDTIAKIDRVEEVLDELLSMQDEALETPKGFFREVGRTWDPSLTDGVLAKRIGEAVKNHREERNLTQKELSDLCGILRPNIARLEGGSNLPSLGTLLKVSHGLELPLVAFLP